MLQDARTAWLDPLAAGYTSLGNGGMIWIAVSLAMLCHRNTRPAGMLALCAMLLGLVCTNLILKPLIMRPRPWLDAVSYTHLDVYKRQILLQIQQLHWSFLQFQRIKQGAPTP